MSRAESKARTRAALLAAAERIVARNGYAGAGVDEIAAEAGYSVGALYSNFRNKEELLLALVSDRANAHVADAAKLLAGGPDADPMAALSRQLVRVADADDLTLLQSELWAYAVRNPRARERLSAGMRGPHDALSTLVGEQRARDDETWAARDDEIATVVLAMFQGLVRQRRLDPASVPDDLYGRALTWLFDGLSVPEETS
ncbi:TetR/AcrR family transcriptional regulator [Pseudonocardia sp. KRD291]|uniref:TetR/AcrR family transcriptional regulator n=1 Tax=Pseudonocardia sp. KRD291 TaxID=2792007 RepID=UPI001C4A26B6|nr:TetR/AcrR family transcriptional regulator [Pseudonocardia sp. KRD291]MBW0103146.1 TetR/AcrR family transcriptional regulator [Pseudonocardia sp. KRD291]